MILIHGVLRWHQVRTFVSHTNNVTAIGFNCDGQLMHSGSEDGTVKIWDMRYINVHLSQC